MCTRFGLIENGGRGDPEKVILDGNVVQVYRSCDFDVAGVSIRV